MRRRIDKLAQQVAREHSKEGASFGLFVSLEELQERYRRHSCGDYSDYDEVDATVDSYDKVYKHLAECYGRCNETVKLGQQEGRDDEN